MTNYSIDDFQKCPFCESKFNMTGKRKFTVRMNDYSAIKCSKCKKNFFIIQYYTVSNGKIFRGYIGITAHQLQRYLKFNNDGSFNYNAKAKNILDKPLSELEFGTRVVNILKKKGYTKVRDINNINFLDIYSIPKFGIVSIGKFLRVCKKYGINITYTSSDENRVPNAYLKFLTKI